MAIEQEIQAVSVAVVGDFNPPIFSPGWLASEGLIRDTERDTATIEVIHPEIASFSIGTPDSGPIKIQVVRNRLFVSAEDARKHEIVRDLVTSILGILRHAPAHQLGINFESHSPKGSTEALNALGDLLAPKKPWTDILEKPLLLSMSMKGQRPDPKPNGFVTVKIETSSRVRLGVAISINDHYELDDPKSVSGSDAIQKMLADNWSPSLVRSRAIVARLGEVDGR